MWRINALIVRGIFLSCMVCGQHLVSAEEYITVYVVVVFETDEFQCAYHKTATVWEAYFALSVGKVAHR